MWLSKGIKTRGYSKIMKVDRICNTIKYIDNITYIRCQSKFDESNNWIETREKHYTHNKCVYVKKYNSEGIFYEEWRDYYSNGVLKKVSNTQGFTQEFTEKGLPIF